MLTQSPPLWLISQLVIYLCVSSRLRARMHSIPNQWSRSGVQHVPTAPNIFPGYSRPVVPHTKKKWNKKQTANTKTNSESAWSSSHRCKQPHAALQWLLFIFCARLQFTITNSSNPHSVAMCCANALARARPKRAQSQSRITIASNCEIGEEKVTHSDIWPQSSWERLAVVAHKHVVDIGEYIYIFMNKFTMFPFVVIAPRILFWLTSDWRPACVSPSPSVCIWVWFCVCMCGRTYMRLCSGPNSSIALALLFIQYINIKIIYGAQLNLIYSLGINQTSWHFRFFFIYFYCWRIHRNGIRRASSAR